LDRTIDETFLEGSNSVGSYRFFELEDESGANGFDDRWCSAFFSMLDVGEVLMSIRSDERNGATTWDTRHLVREVSRVHRSACAAR